MKTMKISALLLVLSLMFASCKKTKDTVVPDGLVGIWAGKYSNSTTGALSSDFVMEIKADGTLLTYNSKTIASASASNKGEGTYTVSNGGLNFTGNYKYKSNSDTYTLNLNTTKDFTDLNGPWQSDGKVVGNMSLKKSLLLQ